MGYCLCAQILHRHEVEEEIAIVTVQEGAISFTQRCQPRQTEILNRGSQRFLGITQDFVRPRDLFFRMSLGFAATAELTRCAKTIKLMNSRCCCSCGDPDLTLVAIRNSTSSSDKIGRS